MLDSNNQFSSNVKVPTNRLYCIIAPFVPTVSIEIASSIMLGLFDTNNIL
ncbi:MAG: hypothetical protein JO297_11275 [Nitrososphaeraceae archaeon]|nr:hypothetical protein [Nitrososphaeraceae archaeon]